MLLRPYRVLDLTGSLGFLTGKIFGDLGADVVKVEPPGGDRERRRPPFLKRDGVAAQQRRPAALGVAARRLDLDDRRAEVAEDFARQEAE